MHIRSHQRTVGVVVLEERNQTRRHRHKLFRADVNVLDLFTRLQHEVAGLTRIAQFGHDAALLVQLHVGLRDDVLVFFPGRQILAVRLVFGRLLFRSQVAVGFFDFRPPDDVAHFVRSVAGIQDSDLVDHHALHHLAVRALDEAELVDARKTGK